ncbi:MAG: DUF502 domain-containing protein [Planctomycetes bacterium]|nr:DUF502 domain-containing protein [Planctomycetota bacterium]
MQRLKNFVKSTVIGGLLVVLPTGILLGVMAWLINTVRGFLSHLPGRNADEKSLALDILAVLLLIVSCFVIGVLVRTRLGKFIYSLIETNILAKAPGYSLVKETVFQFLGNKKSPFSSVALAQIFGNETMVSCFVTDTHEDGSRTVFVPTGPNPTSGNIYHLEAKYVHPVDVSVEDAMRSIISCGAGSSTLLKKLKDTEKT